MSKLQNAVQESVLVPYLIEVMVIIVACSIVVWPLALGKIVGGDWTFAIVFTGYLVNIFAVGLLIAEGGRE